MKKVALAVVALALAVSSVQASVLAGWTFETSVPATAGPLAAEVGSGTATAYHSNAATVYSNPVGNGSVESWSSNTWTTGDYYEFQTSTTGYTDVTISFDQARSSTGPATFDLKASTDGVNWTTLLTDYAVQISTTPNSWSSVGDRKTLFTLGPVDASAFDNQPTVYFRMESKVTPAAGGTNRVDNIEITAVPEPASLMLLGLGGLAVLRRRR